MGNSHSSATQTYGSITNPIKEGYLQKRSKILKTYKKRYIVLVDDKIYSFSDKNLKLTEVIYLRSYNIAIKSPSPFYDHQIELISNSPDDRRFFMAETENEMNEWIKCINDAMGSTQHSQLKKMKITKQEFITSSTEKKNHYNKYPTLKDYANGSISVDAKISKLTNEIISTKASGEASNRDTFLHILHNAAASNGKQCLFFDSSKGIKPQTKSDEDSYLNMVDADDPTAPKFVLKLKKIDSFIQEEKFDKVEKVKEIKEALENNAFHPVIEDIRCRLSKAHNVVMDRIVITDFYLNGVGAPYYIRDLTDSEANKIKTEAATFDKKMDELFPDFDSCAVHPTLYHHMYDINMFDERGNKTFGSSENATYKVGPNGKQKDYKQPTGWTRYGLKVLGKFSDDKWLDPFQDPGNWYRAYHGTDRNAGGWILDKGFMKSTGQMELFPDGVERQTHAACGPGVYCSPNIDTVVNHGYAKRITIPTKKGNKTFVYVLMVGVNPANLNSTKTGGQADYWVAPEPKDVRPYGILIKEV